MRNSSRLVSIWKLLGWVKSVAIFWLRDGPFGMLLLRLWTWRTTLEVEMIAWYSLFATYRICSYSQDHGLRIHDLVLPDLPFCDTSDIYWTIWLLNCDQLHLHLLQWTQLCKAGIAAGGGLASWDQVCDKTLNTMSALVRMTYWVPQKAETILFLKGSYHISLVFEMNISTRRETKLLIIWNSIE